MSRVVDRFFKYVSYDAIRSNKNSPYRNEGEKFSVPELAKELAEIGLEIAKMDEFGYVYGWLPASTGCEDLEPIGLIAHMDTAPSTTGANVKPRIVHYEGGDIELGNGVVTGADYFDYLPVTNLQKEKRARRQVKIGACTDPPTPSRGGAKVAGRV